MNKYKEGFIKRASEYGVNYNDAEHLYKYSGMLGDVGRVGLAGGIGGGLGYLAGGEPGAMIGMAGGAAPALMYNSFPEGTKNKIHGELKDPRLYANIKNTLLFKNRDERVAAHKGLEKNRDGGILSAMWKGIK